MIDIFTEKEKQLQRAFFKIMTSPLFEERGNRYCRVLFYAYIFGTVHVDDMLQLFGSPIENETKYLEQNRNKNRAYLNYFCKKGWLIKREKGYYILDKRGKKELLSFLIQNGYLQEYPVKNENKCSLLSHSNKTGKMILSFIQNGYSGFLLGASFDSSGKRTVLNAMEIRRSGMLIPDGFIMDNNAGERIYMEADGCTERMNTKLIPKLQRYLTTVLENDKSASFSTIHFSIWSNDEKATEKCFDVKLLEQIRSLYYFIVNELKISISFECYYSSILSYKGDNDYINNISNKLQKFHLPNVLSINDLNNLYEIQYDKNDYSKQYSSRMKRIEISIKKIPFLEQLLYQGLRIVCMPLNITRKLIPFVYLEHYDLRDRIGKIINSEFPDCKVISYEITHSFCKNTMGDLLTLRNVYKIDINNKIIYLAVENICCDISASFRVNNYLQGCGFNKDMDLHILCLISKKEHIEKMKERYKHVANIKNVFYITYDRFEKGLSMIK